MSSFATRDRACRAGADSEESHKTTIFLYQAVIKHNVIRCVYYLLSK